MYASANGYTDAMEVLLKAGANMEGRDKFGFTALHVAATTGEAEAIILLLRSGAQLDARDKFGNTALKKAREQKNAEAAKVLEDAATGTLPTLSQSSAASKRPAPEDGAEEEEKPPSKKGKEKAGTDGDRVDELAEVAQSLATHLAQLREHARLAQAMLRSFAEAGGDPRSLNLAPEDIALLAAIRKVA